MGTLGSVPWIVWPIIVPLAVATLAFLLGQRANSLVLVSAVVGVPLTVAALSWQVWQLGPQRHRIGGWGAPLGIDLYADGLSLLMLIITAIVGAITSTYSWSYFGHPPNIDDAQKAAHPQESDAFWPLWLFLWAALNALFLSADVFNLYVTLELLGLSSVALVTLAGERAALVAGMRYLLASLLASLAYLLGVALLYAAFGTLDVTGLGARMTPGPAASAAAALTSLGLLLKTALWPLHFWLPPAHANAPTPVSALLSALVVKASFYLLLRLWFEVFVAALTPTVGELLGVLGAAAIFWGSVQALRQQRLKLLVAYSTVAQIGYLFLVFPLATVGTWGIAAWSGGVYHALSHACAKAAMFLAAGNLLRAVGHDRISDLEGTGQTIPMSTFAFALAGVTLMGLPPSGGFIAKWLLLTAALESGQWWWAGVIVMGGLLAAGYLFLVLRRAFVPLATEIHGYSVLRRMELAPLALALIALLLGVIAAPVLTLLQLASPFAGR
jgi:formate hydrogenlyase subunit 3/multisubunit Na+/H+ antiporter MnhD subunit